jgi:hypothetical protein
MELAHSSEGYPMPALSPVDEAGLMFLVPVAHRRIKKLARACVVGGSLVKSDR